MLLDGDPETSWSRYAPPGVAPRRAPSALARGVGLGAASGLVSSFSGLPYFVENAARQPPVAWAILGALFVALLVVTGAMHGGAIVASVAAADRWFGRRAAWGPPLVAAAVTGVLSSIPGGIGTAYFGGKPLPYMGNAAVFAIPGVMSVGLAIASAWLDGGARLCAAPRAAAAGVALVAPIAAGFAVLFSFASDDDALHFFQTMPLVPLGVGLGALLGALYGLYAGAVVSLTRRLRARSIARRR